MSKPQIDKMPRPSLLPFNPADLVAMRVLPAEFARMVGVSKQSVSQWLKQGKITLGPDGRLDPAVASRRLIECSDPARLRARVFKQATASFEGLRRRITELETELEEERELSARKQQAAKWCAQDEAAQRLTRFTDALALRLSEAVEAESQGRWSDWIDELVALEFYGESPLHPAAESADFDASCS